MSRYLNMIQDDNTPVTVYSTTSRDLLKNIFLHQQHDSYDYAEMKRIFSNEAQIKFQNIRLVSCDDSIKSLTDHNLIIYDENAV